MSKAADAYRTLVAAMEDTKPSCRDDRRYTADTLTKDDAASMATLCKVCPLFDLCKEYAQLERPKAGYWASRQYPTKKEA